MLDRVVARVIGQKRDQAHRSAHLRPSACRWVSLILDLAVEGEPSLTWRRCLLGSGLLGEAGKPLEGGGGGKSGLPHRTCLTRASETKPLLQLELTPNSEP